PALALSRRMQAMSWMSCSVTASISAARRVATRRAKGLPVPSWLPLAKRPSAWRPVSAEGAAVEVAAVMDETPRREGRRPRRPGGAEYEQKFIIASDRGKREEEK